MNATAVNTTRGTAHPETGPRFAKNARPMRMIPAFSLLLSALVLSGCASLTGQRAAPAPVAAAQSTGLVPQAGRITDERILGDRKTLAAVQQRLQRLSEAGVPQNSYALSKAQCWLDTAKTQYHENDRTGYVEESLVESMKITQALEANMAAQAGFDTPLVAGSTRLRDDLWARLAGFKGNAGTLSCNARAVACAEVRLVRAGHAEQQTGWRQATPHVAMAEDLVRQAAEEAANCRPATATMRGAAPVTTPAGTATGPVPAPVPAAVVQKESIVLLGDALFKFNRSGRDDLLPGGLDRLREVADYLKKFRAIETIDYVGHTDRYGRRSYNEALSLARANTVRAHLESLGVKALKTTTEGRGAREPVVECSTKPPKAQQVVCLQPNRRVQIEVLGVR